MPQYLISMSIVSSRSPMGLLTLSRVSKLPDCERHGGEGTGATHSKSRTSNSVHLAVSLMA